MKQDWKGISNKRGNTEYDPKHNTHQCLSCSENEMGTIIFLNRSSCVPYASKFICFDNYDRNVQGSFFQGLNLHLKNLQAVFLPLNL